VREKIGGKEGGREFPMTLQRKGGQAHLGKGYPQKMESIISGKVVPRKTEGISDRVNSKVVKGEESIQRGGKGKTSIKKIENTRMWLK